MQIIEQNFGIAGRFVVADITFGSMVAVSDFCTTDCLVVGIVG